MPGYYEPGRAISGDGTKIAVLDNADPTGGNPDGSPEIFLFDIATSTFTQITNFASPFVGSFGGLAINANGTRVVIKSTANLTGGNPDLNNEIYLLDTTTNIFTQITNTTGLVINGSPVINADGTRIAFHAFADLTGENPDGHTETFLINTTTNTFIQITHTTGSVNQWASINADGTHIAFASTADLIGGNPDGSGEIFLFNTTTNTFTQITNNMGTVTGLPSISPDGTRIAFPSNGNGRALLV